MVYFNQAKGKEMIKMTIYTFYVMTKNDYNNYMQGSNNYWMERKEVAAETEEMAMVKAKNLFPDMIILDLSAKAEESVDTFSAMMEQKRMEAKAKRQERENQPGYKAARNYRRKATEIKKMQAEIERLYQEIKKAELKKKEYAEIYLKETGNEIEEK